MIYDIEKIKAVVSGELISKPIENKQISSILIDSRQLINADNTVFFALITKRNDGHKYIDELYNKGVKAFVVSVKSANYENYTGASFILVKDTLAALQQLCSYHRKQFNIPVIGITGSNGKTIVKEWLYQLMCEDKNIVRNPKSYNSQIGVPLSVWQMSEENELGIFEAGISEPDEMEKLQSIINPQIGIFTNIGEAHNENFININQKVGEKLKLFKKSDTIIYCSDYFEIQEKIYQSDVFSDKKLFSWSKTENSNLRIIQIEKKSKYTYIYGIYNNKKINIEIPFYDDASIENAIICWATMLCLGYEDEIIIRRFRNLLAVAMRLELKEGINNCTLINDSYNSDLNSLKIAIDFLNQQNQHKSKTIILSDILQTGKTDDELYSEVSDLLENKGINRIIGIGNSIINQQNKFKIEKDFYKTTQDFIHNIDKHNFINESILIKGARIYGFESISNALQQKVHDTVLEINLNSLVHNLNHYKSLLKKDTKIMAMVKAFSYGSGSFEIANVLQYHNIDYLAVAYADEGVELRKAGITVPIMVMNPEGQSFDSIMNYNLEPEIYSFRILNTFITAIKERYNLSEQKFPVHIKIDTGMHRLGFEENQIDELINQIQNSNCFKIQSVFSHLVGSDDPDLDYYTNFQIDTFNRIYQKFEESFDYKILKHILNSSGISRFTEYQFNMVRLGIGLYGIGANSQEQEQLQNVSTLKTIISQIKYIKEGETIGYSRKWKVEQDLKIATIPIGYADGLSRMLSNGKGRVYINGKMANIIGNICMDMCMIDITDIQANEGEEVIIFGKQYTLNQIANDMQTIPYEVLTSVSRRVKRIYYHE